jgi:hypothetical protein
MIRSRFRGAFRFGAVLLFAALAGCGDKSQFKTYSAEGTVTLNGNPLAGAHVWLLPKNTEHQNAQIVVRPQGTTNSEGKFTLTTYYQNDGAPLGEYDVIVLHGDIDPDADSGESKGKKSKKPIVPHKYKDAKTSGLSTTVASGDNHIKLELTTK